MTKNDLEDLFTGSRIMRGARQMHNAFRNFKSFDAITIEANFGDEHFKRKAGIEIWTGKTLPNDHFITDRVLGEGSHQRAKYFVLIVNHPNGESKPTDYDKGLMTNFGVVAPYMYLKLLDYVIVGKEPNDYWSLYESNGGGATYRDAFAGVLP